MKTIRDLFKIFKNQWGNKFHPELLHKTKDFTEEDVTNYSELAIEVIEKDLKQLAIDNIKKLQGSFSKEKASGKDQFYSPEEINLFSDISSELGFLEGFAFPSFEGKKFTKEEMDKLREEHTVKINSIMERLQVKCFHIPEESVINAKTEVLKEVFGISEEDLS